MFSHVEVWYRSHCPHCKKMNWVAESSKYDIDGVQCWKCSKVYGHGTEADLTAVYDVYLDEYGSIMAYIESEGYVSKGMPAPFGCNAQEALRENNDE